MGLCIVQVAGLTIHALDHLDIADRAELHENEHHAFSVYRTIVEAPSSVRRETLKDMNLGSGAFSAEFSSRPDNRIPATPVPVPLAVMGMTRGMRPPRSGEDLHFEGPPPPESFGEDNPRGFGPPPFAPRGDSGFERMPPLLNLSMLPRQLFPRRIFMGHEHHTRRYTLSLLLPDEPVWLIVRFTVPPPNPFGSPTFLVSFALMTICGGTLILWGTQRLIAPVATLANAAEALGRDVNASPLPEGGPTEIRRAALAFNTMAARIRRFVTDRTLMLTAIGHDLRTPITRLKLRAEFIDDDELRDKFLADLDEMESMVAATLAFGRDSVSREPSVSLDLNALLQTIADEAAEGQPNLAEEIVFEPPQAPVRLQAQSLALKRALTNLVTNALKYGGSAHMTLTAPPPQGRERHAVIIVEDHGPGLPDEDLERMFEPFVRAETSRNRETGGSGLGLAIARSIIRAQGGDVRLENRPEGGLRAVIRLLA